MSPLASIGFGLVHGIVFFVYLCLFRHVQDTIPSGGQRRFLYLLIAVSFVILGRLTGISVALGLIPMILLLRIIPKGKDREFIGWSLAFTVFMTLRFLAVPLGTGFESGERNEITEANEMLRRVKELDVKRNAIIEQLGAVQSIDPEKFFVSEVMDPKLELDRYEKVDLAGGKRKITINMPIPVGYVNSKKAEDDRVSVYIFQKDDLLQYAIIFDKIFLGDTEAELSISSRKTLLGIDNTATAIINNLNILRPMYRSVAVVTFSPSPPPVIVQNTPQSIAMFSCYEATADSSCFVLEGLTFLHNSYVPISFIMFGGSPEEKKASSSWLLNTLLEGNTQDDSK